MPDSHLILYAVLTVLPFSIGHDCCNNETSIDKSYIDGHKCTGLNFASSSFGACSLCCWSHFIRPLLLIQVEKLVDPCGEHRMSTLFPLHTTCPSSMNKRWLIETYRTDLLECLLVNSDKVSNIRPQYDQGTPLTITVELSMYDVGYEDPNTMTYECSMYMEMKWTDRRMAFNSCRTNDSFTISGIDVEKCWRPDLYFHHGRKETYYTVLRKNEDIYLYKEGDVVFSTRLTLKLHCFLDLSHYPFDKQNCEVKVRSYGFHANDLILKWAPSNPISVRESPRLSVVDWGSSFEATYIDQSANYSVLKANLRYKRVSTSYNIMYIGPPVASVIVTFFSFLLIKKDTIHDHITVRLNICTGAFTATVMLWAGIYAKLPPVVNLSMLDYWLLSNICFIGGIAIVHIIVYRFEMKYCFVFTLKVLALLSYCVFVPVFICCFWMNT